ncbi:hypothetical protein KEM52_005275, partial [Ascosphaera acerosa]
TTAVQPHRAPSRFLSIFACCASKASVTEDERSIPAARAAKAGSRQTSGVASAPIATRQATPSRTSTLREKERVQDQQEERPAEPEKSASAPQKSEDAKSSEKIAANEPSGQADESRLDEKQQSELESRQEAPDQSNQAQPLPSANGVGDGAAQQSEPLREHRASDDAPAPDSTAGPPTETREEAIAREAATEVDDATALALDEAVTSPTPILPHGDDGLDFGAFEDLQLTPNLLHAANADDSELGGSSVAVTRQSQIQPPQPPSTSPSTPGSPSAEFDHEGQPWLLPPLEPHLKKRKCLVLDLDETLVHSSFKVLDKADFTIPVEIEGQYHNIYVIKRPGVDQFMKRVGELYEVVVFTASVSKYGDPLLDQLDIHKVVHHRLFRDSCHNHFGNYVKNLARVGRDLREVIIIDNSPTSYIFHPEHAIPISSWFSDVHDNELLDLIPVLEDLADANVTDVRLVLNVAL